MMKLHRIYTLAPVAILGTMLSLACMAGTPSDDEFSQAMALEGDVTNGQKIFSICSACHTTEGWGTNDGLYPQLAGQHSSVLIKQLSDVRAGKRGNVEMHPLAMYDAMGGPKAIADVVPIYEIYSLRQDGNHSPGRTGVLEILCQFFNLSHNRMRRIDNETEIQF